MREGPRTRGAAPSRKARRAAVFFVLITILLDTIGFGIIAPVMPKLLTSLTGEGLDSVVRYSGWLMFVYAAVQFVAAPLLGNLSDRFGRRPVLLMSLVALGLDYLLMAWAPSLVWLFLGRLLAGLAGATFSTANAYVADVSSDADRARNFGYISAAWGLGFMLGPAIGGVLGEYGVRVPFVAAAGLAALNVVYGLLVLPESLPPHRRRAFSFARANPVGALVQIRRHPAAAALLLVLVPYQIAHDANPATWSYYAMFKFGWSTSDVGWSLFVVGASIMLVNGLLVGPAIARLGERRSVVVGLAFMSLGFIGFAFATEGWMLIASILPFALIGLAQPALRSMMAARVPADAQGELQGAVGSLMSLVMIFSPLVMTGIFSYFSAPDAPLHFPGAAFLTAGLLGGVALALFRWAVAREGAALMPAPGP